jgi:hypothetical protein
MTETVFKAWCFLAFRLAQSSASYDGKPMPISE